VKITIAAAFVALALATVTAASADPVRGKDGILRYHLGGTPPVLHCPVNMVCDIALLSDDVILKDSPPVAGDMEDFDIKVTPLSPPHVFIVAEKPFKRTNLTVITSTRVYHFYIWSVPNTGQISGTSIAFFPPRRIPPSVPAFPIVIVSPQPSTANDDPDATIDLSTANCKPDLFTITGSAPFRPLRVCVDSVRTYIEIGQTAEVPALLGFDDRGGIRAINYGYHSGIYVVPAQYPRYRLVLGSGKDMESIDIARR
jgi:hypothetical protein